MSKTELTYYPLSPHYDLIPTISSPSGNPYLSKCYHIYLVVPKLQTHLNFFSFTCISLMPSALSREYFPPLPLHCHFFNLTSYHFSLASSQQFLPPSGFQAVLQTSGKCSDLDTNPVSHSCIMILQWVPVVCMIKPDFLAQHTGPLKYIPCLPLHLLSPFIHLHPMLLPFQTTCNSQMFCLTKQ